jgi:hypothetical protein
LVFHNPDGTRGKGNAGAPSVLVAYGPEAVRRLKACKLKGQFIQLKP